MTQIEAVVNIKLDLQGKELMRTKGEGFPMEPFDITPPNQEGNYVCYFSLGEHLLGTYRNDENNSFIFDVNDGVSGEFTTRFE